MIRMARAGARAIVAVVAVVALAAASGCTDEDTSADATNATDVTATEIEGVEIVRIGPYEHPSGDIDYDRHPPVGGDHNPQAVRCGIYDEPVRDEWAVHSIEHGAVWIAHQERIGDGELDTIESLGDEHDKLVVAPYPGLDSPIVVTAWGAQLRLDSASDPRLEAFIERFVDASSAPEAGGGC